MPTSSFQPVRRALAGVALAGLLAAAAAGCSGCGTAAQPESGTDPDLSNVPAAAWDPQTPAIQGDDALDAAALGDAATLDDAAIGALIDEVASPVPDDGAGPDAPTPEQLAASQDPADFAAAHPQAYGKLLDGGDATLGRVARLFLEGGQTGVRAEVMFLLMQELLGEEAPLVEVEIADPASLAQADAQARFGAWFAAAGILLDRHGLDFMRENMPHTYAVVTAMQE